MKQQVQVPITCDITCVLMGECSWHSTCGDALSLMGFALGCPGSGHPAAGLVARLLVPQRASEAIP